MTEHQEAMLALYGVSGVGSRLFARLFAMFGSAGAVFDASAKELAQVEGVGQALAGRIRAFDRRAFVDRQLALMEQAGALIVVRGDDEYPSRLDTFPSAPPVLFARGDVAALGEDGIAIVGTRGQTTYGKKMTREFAVGAVNAGLSIISGMAAGVDATAHRTAIEHGGRTVAVFGCGIDNIYPVNHCDLAEDIAAHGCLVSHFPMGTPATRGTFPARNAVIVGLARGTIVVEAGQSSGALLTARLTTRAGRPLFAVPGNADADKSRGTNALIAEGAVPLTDIGPVLEAMGAGHSATVRRHAEAPLPKGLPGDILRVLGDGPRHIDEIIGLVNATVREVSPHLTELELDGRVLRRPGAYYERA